MAKNESLTASQICKAAKNKKFVPIYILMGEESYYIDYISDIIMENALTEDERDFNLTIFYGLDSDVKNVISTCKRFPVMSERQVIIVKEAQMMTDIDMLQHYVSRPLNSTILIICNKNGNLKATETMKIAKSSDDVVIFESKKVTEKTISPLINDYILEKGFKASPKSVSMLKDFIGTDLSRLFGEIDKLAIILEKGTEITPEVIERNIGISKDYNNFELESALRERNFAKAMTIVNYFEKNPKSNPTVLTTSILFNLFSTLLLMHTSKDKSEAGLMKQIEAKSPWRVKMLSDGLRNYSASSCFISIGYIREFDTKSKGVNSRQNEYDLLKELIFKITHS